MQKPPRDLPLVPFADFKKAAPHIVAVTKRESDQQIASLQAGNARR